MKSLGEWRVTDLAREVVRAVEISGGAPNRILLQFQARRVAGLHGVDALPGWTWERAHDARDVPNAIVLAREDPAEPIPPALRVASQGDALRLARIVLDLPGGKRAVQPERRAEPSLPPTPEEETSVFGTSEYLGAMSEAFAALPRSTLTRYRAFFFQLDRRTEADLVRSSPREAESPQAKRVVGALRYVRRALEARTEAQMRACCDRPSVAVPFQDPESFRDYVETISDVFARLLWEHFPDETGGIDLEEFDDAFEMFATGELRFWLQKHNVFTTEPSSGAFFLFGQFALLAAECGVEPELWTRLANVMVRSQRLYCATYPAATPRPRLADYRAANHAPHQRPTPRERARLRARYAGFGLPQLSLAALRNLAELAPGEWDALGLAILPGVALPPLAAAPVPPGPPPGGTGGGTSSRAGAEERDKQIVPPGRPRTVPSA